MNLEIKYCKTCHTPMNGVIKQKQHKKDAFHYVYAPHKVYCDSLCQKYRHRKRKLTTV